MIIVHINPVKVEAAYVESCSDVMEDLCLAVWPLVRKHLSALDKELREVAGKMLENEAGPERGAE